MSEKPLFSVVICYRNWGGERLRLAAESHLRSTLREHVEVIVSDFGSDADRRADAILAGMPVRCVYTETGEPWSRSRALNAGVAAARGDYILAWDADILCAPELHEELLAHFMAQPNAAYPLQCRDLNADYNEAKVRELLDEHDDLPVDLLRENSAWRPRWGMGIAAYRRTHFDLVRGYDERFVIWGGEDRDLMNRFSRLGITVRWIDSPAAEIFHIFHGSSLDEASRTTEGQAAVTRNHDYVQRDRTIFRNLSNARHLKTQRPLVSVIIATHNRAAYLPETLPSILEQTFRDLELIVVDDGSTDDTAAVLQGFSDERLIVIRQENAGVAAARNAGIREARGHFMLVHDDDDIMLPNRIEVQLAALERNAAGSYGGWIDFDSESGEFVNVNSGKDFSAEAIAYAGKVLLHPTVMTTRWAATRIPYDDRYRGGSDFNWMMTIAANGATLVHTGNIHILRRLHGSSLTSGGSGQKHASRASARSSNSGFGYEALQELRALGRATESRRCAQEDNLDELYQYLPGPLRKREFHFAGAGDPRVVNDVLKAASRSEGRVAITSTQPVYRAGVSLPGLHRLHGIAETREAAEACLAGELGDYRGWESFGPIAARTSFPGLATGVPAVSSVGFMARLGSEIPGEAWALLDDVAAFYAIGADSVLVAVQRARKDVVRLGKVDQVMRGVCRQASRIAVLQAPDGVVPVYRLNRSESVAAGLRELAGAWAARKLSFVVHQRGDAVGGES
ncbi:MAG TPA: glycosyltransferase [Gammaproteobacteria bacterium]